MVGGAGGRHGGRRATLIWLVATSAACGNLLGADDLRFDRSPSAGGDAGAAVASSPGGRFTVPKDSWHAGGNGASGVFGGVPNAGSGNDHEPSPNAGTGGDEGDPSDGGEGPDMTPQLGAGGTPNVHDVGGAPGFAGSPPDAVAGTSGATSVVYHVTPLIPAPPTYGFYCSAQSGTGWALSMAAEPCADLFTRFSWGSDSVRRAGLYDREGRNNVIVRCDGANRTFFANGAVPFTKAYTWAVNESRKSCVFTSAPARLPIFRSPFALDPLPADFEVTNRAHDFATVPGAPGAAELPEATLDVRDYLQTALDPSRCAEPSPGCATTVSYRGEDRSAFPEGNDSQGFEWRMAVGTPIRAMANGAVIARRTRPAQGCKGGEQSEIYIKHVVANPGFSSYAETFVVHYSHLHFTLGTEVGKVVQAGQVVGAVIANECTGGAGLFHLSVIRLSNTATEYRPTLDTTPGVYGRDGRAPDNSVSRIDPYGWLGLHTMDPGGFRWANWSIPFMGDAGATRVGGGAWSIDLWREDEAPPRPCDRNDKEWPTASGSLENPHAHCER